MKTLKNIAAALPLLALFLTGCAGIGQEPDEKPDPSLFIALADQAPCPGNANRLFVIDNRYVYWYRGAACDNQAQRLYGSTTDNLLCVQVGSDEAASTTCADVSVRALFDTILANRQAADLGLGAGHAVVPLQILPYTVLNLTFATVAKESFSAINSPRTVVIRNQIAWATLWAQHTAKRTPRPPLPKVDFTTQMLVGVFAGDLKGCHEFAIQGVNIENGQIIVNYDNRDITAQTICIAAITNPMHVVAVPSIDAQVVFNEIALERLQFNTIDRSSYSRIQEPQNVVVRNPEAWAALWRRHAGAGRTPPAIDFDTTMAVAVFRGLAPNGCYSTEIVDVYREGPGLTVSRIDTVPGQGAICTLAVVTPAHLIAVPHVNGPVRFTAERRPVP